MNGDDITKLLYIINENLDMSTTGFNTALLENVDAMIENGLLKREDNTLKVDVPVFFAEEYDGEFVEIIQSTRKQLGEDVRDVIIEYLQDKALPCPKHLTVPKRRLYDQSKNCLDMMLVYEAQKRGLVMQNVDYPCPAVLMIINK